MKNAVIVALVVALAVSVVVGVIAQASRTVNVQVRVWQDVSEPGALWLSARPDGGSWADAGTVPVPLDDGLSGTGRYRYGDVTLALSVPPPPSCAEPSLAADCAVLLAARDALAGDGALNWSADVPVTQWDGVTVSGEPWRVTGLDLRNRGLTGTVLIELGSLPPTLAAVYLAGNAFTGCVPERLRLAENNDAYVVAYGLSWCPVAQMWSGVAAAAGTWDIDGIIVDIPADGPRVQLSWTMDVDTDEPGGSGSVQCLSDLADLELLCLDYEGRESWRGPSFSEGEMALPGVPTDSVPAGLDAVFDQIAASARPAPPLPR